MVFLVSWTHLARSRSIVSLSIAVSDAMMRPIMLTSTTSRNSNCPRREPMQYFCICFRASLSIHSAGWIFPFSTFITSCFSGHNTLFFLAVSGFCGLHDTIWPFKASPQPTFGTEQTPALRAFVAARGSLRPTRFLLLYFKRVDNREYHAVFVHNPSHIAWPHAVGRLAAADVFLFILAVVIRFKQHETSTVYAMRCRPVRLFFLVINAWMGDDIISSCRQRFSSFLPAALSALSSVGPLSYEISFMSRMRDIVSADIEAGYDS